MCAQSTVFADKPYDADMTAIIHELSGVSDIFFSTHKYLRVKKWIIVSI